MVAFHKEMQVRCLLLSSYIRYEIGFFKLNFVFTKELLSSVTLFISSEERFDSVLNNLRRLQ